MDGYKLSPIIPSFAPEKYELSLDCLLVPARHFKRPQEVLNDLTLELQEKRAILSSWASDACALESMPALRQPAGVKQPISFHQIMEAPCQLDGNARAPRSGWGESRQSFDRLDA